MLTADERTLRTLRGGQMGMVFQEPMSALNPLHTIGDQINEAMEHHKGKGREEITLIRQKISEGALDREGPARWVVFYAERGERICSFVMAAGPWSAPRHGPSHAMVRPTPWSAPPHGVRRSGGARFTLPA